MDEERVSKAFSSSSTLLWNFSSSVPSFLSHLLNPRKRLKYLKKFTGLCTKKKDVLFLLDFLLKKKKKFTHNISGKKGGILKAKKGQSDFTFYTLTSGSTRDSDK